jgi:hypothetical protein
MALLIDGYNLLHASGILGRGIGPGGLERSRLALLNFLAESLDESDLSRTTIVFDAAAAPPGLPRTIKYRGLSVHFAAGYADADELIEELIQENSGPRQLTVVSSDHRLHRAARRRKARAVDSDRWYTQVVQGRANRQSSSGSNSSAKPPPPATPEEIRFWLRQFSDAPSNVEPRLANPFPAGYGDDVRDDSKGKP